MTTIQAQLKRVSDSDLSKERLLNEYLSDTNTVYTVLRSVSSSGMTRHISNIFSSGGIR